MLHSKLTSKGQTTIPGEVRAALSIKPGDQLTYTIEQNRVVIRVHPGARALRGALASDEGSGMSIGEMRQVAAKRSRRQPDGRR